VDTGFFLSQLRDNRHKDPRRRQGADNIGFTTGAADERGQCFGVGSIGGAVVLVEIVQWITLAAQVPSFPGLSGGVSASAGACQRRRYVSGKLSLFHFGLATAGSIQGLRQGKGTSVECFTHNRTFNTERHQGTQGHKIIET